MKNEIKTAIERLVESLLSSVGDSLTGKTTDTIEEIKERNINVALIRVNELLTMARFNITKKSIPLNNANLTKALNEELR